MTARRIGGARATIAGIAALTIGAASAEPVSCLIGECRVGSTVWSAPASGGIYAVCPTAALSEYVNAVGGLISLARTVGAGVPERSPDTGEPSFTDETKAMLGELRQRAGVRTFDEAAAQCRRGAYSQPLIVKAIAGRSILVTTKKTPSESFWMPSNSADLRR